eukprot:TRINITY_DN27700_c0_g1_i1.p1 TRINITY_DN27700_c0_g1~~TRINITY_DN27700_c0_g1_i1.p1  ORF type:complete len:528 (-),score=55.93 TRINITY_DN27700_c0_g1_i1:210-1769(-)
MAPARASTYVPADTPPASVPFLRKCRSAEEASTDRDYFTHPDGTSWSLPCSWGIADRVRTWCNVHKLTGYRSLQQSGEVFWDEYGEEVVFELPHGRVVKDIPMADMQPRTRRQSMRCRNALSTNVDWRTWALPTRPQRYFLCKERLWSVLDAMMDVPPKPLPPLRLDDSGALSNGFHRYFASLVLGFTEIAVEAPQHPRRNARQPRFVPRHVAARKEAEKAERHRRREQARKDRHTAGKEVLGSIFTFSSDGHNCMMQWNRGHWPERQLVPTYSEFPGLSFRESGAKMAATPLTGNSPVDVLLPECFHLYSDSCCVYGAFPRKVQAELRRAKAHAELHVLEALELGLSGREMSWRSYEICVSQLCLDTLDRYGLHPRAPERFGLWRYWGENMLRPIFRGRLDQAMEQTLRRIAYCLERANDRRFLLHILNRNINRHDLRLQLADFERMLSLCGDRLVSDELKVKRSASQPEEADIGTGTVDMRSTSDLRRMESCISRIVWREKAPAAQLSAQKGTVKRW